MYVNDRHDITLAVKVALNPNTTNPLFLLVDTPPNEFKPVLLCWRANNSSCSGPIGPMIEFIQILLDINNLNKFGADWSILVNDRLCINKVKYNCVFPFFLRAYNSDHSVPITFIIKLFQDLTVTYIKTM